MDFCNFPQQLKLFTVSLELGDEMDCLKYIFNSCLSVFHDTCHLMRIDSKKRTFNNKDFFDMNNLKLFTA